MKSPIEIAKQTLEQRQEFAESLRILLEEAKNINQDKLLVTKVQNVSYASYVGAVSFKQLAFMGKYAHTLDWFSGKTIKNKFGEEIGVIRDDAEIKNDDLITQRPIKYPRQRDLVDYLLSHEDNFAKFPPITAIVLTADSMKKDNTQFYNADGKAVKNSLEFKPLDSNGDLGFLNISDNFTIYALDGQHRLLAFKGIEELLSSSEKILKPKNAQNIPVNNEDKIIRLDNYGFKNDSYIHDIFNQKVAVEFIPGVYKGETFDESISRVRSHFIDYNDKSEKLKKVDTAPIDDRDPFNRMAKAIAQQSNFLKRKEVYSSTKAAPSKGSSIFITLVYLRQMANIIFDDKRKSHPMPWYKPDGIGTAKNFNDNEIKKYLPKFIGLIDAIASLDDIKNYLATPEVEGTRAKDFRMLSFEKLEFKKNRKGHVLFTNVGLMALTHAYKNLVIGTLDSDVNNDGPKITAAEFGKKLRKFEAQGANFNYDRDKDSIKTVGLRHISIPQSIFYGILLSINRERMIVREHSTVLAGKILTYILGPGDFEETKKLQQSITSNRIVRADYINWDGKKIKVESDGDKIRNPIELPSRI